MLPPEEALAAERDRRQRLLAQAVPAAQEGPPAELVLAADQFIITPAGRTEEAARARASGDEVRTVIAGYHWFTDWGRDTMISLEGLTLVTGRDDRGRLHPANLRPLRPRWPDPEHVSGRRKGRPVPHGRRDAVVLPCRRPLRALHERHAHARDVVSHAQEDRRGACPRHAVRHPRRPARSACSSRAPPAISSPGWTRRSTTGS